MLILHGEKGAAKTLLQWLIKQLVDPSRPVLFTIHANRDEFVQQLSHNYVAYYDNVKSVPLIEIALQKRLSWNISVL